MKTLIIDNYDSFTFNLYQYIAEITASDPIVIHHDTHTYEEIIQLPVDQIIISPGPGHPGRSKDFGVCQRVLQESPLPVLGICLGHQGLSTAFGGQVILAPEPVHGRVSLIHHWHDALFKDIPPVFNAVRYHSLMVDPLSLPSCLKVIAATEDGIIMGLRHRTRPLFGIQYHPESICTDDGKSLLKNFLAIAASHAQAIESVGQFSKDMGSSNRPGKRLLSKSLIDTGRTNNHYSLSVRQLKAFVDPSACFQQLFAKQIDTAWLDSSLVMSGISRFSIMGCLNGPLSYALTYDAKTSTLIRTQGQQTTQYKMSLFEYLDEELNHYAVDSSEYPFQFACGFVGYFGYEMFQETLPLKAKHVSPYPDAQFLFLDRAIVFDHHERTCYLLALHANGQSASADSWFDEMVKLLEKIPQIESIKSKGQLSYAQKANVKCGVFNQTKAQYLEHIQACLQAINAGESYEMCLTNQFKLDAKVDPLAYYLHLRRINPAPYAAFLRFENLAIASASIERFLQIDPAGQVETKPIKGTLPRGKTPEEDALFKYQLQHDSKFKAENLMIVDLLRNDLGRVCEVGSVHVPKLMQVETYQTLHQLVSTIRGKLRSDCTAIDCIRAVFPGGSMTGAPKIRTVEMIQELEPEARGVYAGSLGYLSLNRSVDLNIVIRTAMMTDKQFSVGVGGAIIALSEPEQEYEEMLLKVRSLQQALQEIIVG